MRKCMLSLIAVCSLISCRELRAIRDERLTLSNDSVLYFSDAEKTKVVTNIEGKSYNLLFDTGAGVTILYDGGLQIPEKRILNKRSVKNFNGEKIAELEKFVATHLSTAAYHYQNKILYKLPSMDLPCTEQNIAGLLSRTKAPTGYMTEINYDRGFLRFLSKPDLQGYQKLNAKYNTFDGLFEVELGINGISGYFVFDTGNTVGVFLDSKMYQFNNPVEKLSYYTIMLGNQPVIMNSNLHLLLFKVGELQFKQYAAINSEKSHNNIGLKFIKQFNWILDEQNGFAYCKPIHPEQLRTDLEHKNRPNMANSAVINSKLIVAQMNYKDENFALGDEIISVNDTLVNSQNMCELSNKYNLEPDKRKLNVTYRRNIGPLD